MSSSLDDSFSDEMEDELSLGVNGGNVERLFASLNLRNCPIIVFTVRNRTGFNWADEPLLCRTFDFVETGGGICGKRQIA